MEDEAKRLAELIIKVLEEKGKAHLLPKILEEIEKKKKKEEAILILARKFDEQTIKEIKEKVEKILKKEVKVQFDEGIIGGFLIKDGNYLIDASIKGFLNRSEKILWKFTKT
jgi:F-type H+-transporting ATPase subunit delta